MIRRDYIMRLIEQFAKSLAEFIFKIKAGKMEEVRSEIKSASLYFLGLDLMTILRLSNKNLIELFSRGDHLDTLKCYIASQLIFVHAQICERQNQSSEATEQNLKSLDLFLTCFGRLEDAVKNEVRGRIGEIVPKLSQVNLPADLIKKLMLFYEQLGRYSQAEDCLFELVDLGAEGTVELGEVFYERLLAKSDADLEEGNLPRDEVFDGLAELKTRFSRSQ